MADETKHGTPSPTGPNRPGRGPQVECGEFEILLSDALEGQLSDARRESFDSHRRICPTCGPLFADAQAGRQWLRALEEVEPPAQLVHNILAVTSGIESAQSQLAAARAHRVPLGDRVRAWWDSYLTPTAAFVRQPRFVMSFGMIFFSFSLALSAAGVKASDVTKIDLRPSALKQKYYLTQGRIVKFYENIRFVYEIESRVREFKRATTPAEPRPQKPAQNQKNNTSGQPDQRQDRNYSREENQPVLAGLLAPSSELQATSYEPEPASCGLRAASYESRALSEPARSSRLVARGYLQPPAVGTTNRRYV